MKRVIFIATALILGLSINSFAKEQPKPVKATPVAAADTQKQVVKSIFSYKADLGLTDKQEADIKKFLLDLQNTLQEKAGKLNILRQELSLLIQDRANLRVIRKKIDEIGKIQVDSAYLDIEASRKIEDTLSAAQLKKWHDIQNQARQELQAEIKAKQDLAAKVKK